MAQARPLGMAKAECGTVGDSDRRHCGDRPRRLFRDESRLSGSTQADRDALSRERRDEQDAGRDLAAICAALSRVFHGHHHARAARRPGAGRGCGESGS
jgi:hypothetical protein